MTLNQLRAFLEAARNGSFTVAAATMQISQASVSELIRRLEDEHDVQLFIRGRRQLVLTTAGQELLSHAETAVTAAESGAQALRSTKSLSGGVATFGMLRNADYYLLSGLVQRFHEMHPEVRVRLIGFNSADVASAVADGSLEAGLVVLPVDAEGLLVTPWARDEVLYVSADPSHTATPVPVDQLARQRVVLYDAHAGWRDPTRRQLLDRANVAGVQLDPWIETIASRAVMTAHTETGHLHTASFDPPLYDTLAFVRRDSVPLSAATREIATLAHDMLQERFGQTQGARS